MRIRTKLIGTFSIMLVLIVSFQGLSLYLTHRGIASLDGVYREVNERRVALEARGLMLDKMVAFSNCCLFPDEGYMDQVEFADKAFVKKLGELESILKICGNKRQLELLGDVRLKDGMLNKQVAGYAGVLKGGRQDRTTIRQVLLSVEKTEYAVLSGIGGLSEETEGMISGNSESFSVTRAINRVFNNFSSTLDSGEKVQSSAMGLWEDLEIDRLASLRAVAVKRFLLTGEQRYVDTFNQLGDSLAMAIIKSGRAGKSGKTFDEVKGFNDSVTSAFGSAVLAYRSGDPDLARKTIMQSFLDEQMLESFTHDKYFEDVNEVDSAHKALSPLMNYALSHNRQLLLFIIMAAALTFVFGYFSINRMVMPIRRLKDAAQKVAQGDWKQHVEVISNDEIAEMAEAFNEMTAQLEEKEAQLRSSRQKYKTIVENVGAGVALVGPNMEMLGANGLMRRWFPEITGTAWPFCFVGYEAEIIKAVEYGLPHESAFEIQRDGRPVDYRIITSPILGEDGSVAGAVEILEDITERLRLNQEKAGLMTELVRSNQELQDFAYIASHDLQSPLRKIVSFSQLLEASLEGRLSSDDLENMNFLVSAAMHMQRLINDLLSYSRVTTRGKPLEAVDMGLVFKEAINISLASRLDDTGGKVQVEGALPWVMADSTQLHQLLQNLVDNGLKYHADGVSPAVRINARDLGGGMVRVEVSDNGIGIDEQYYEKVFRMFQRLHGAGKYEGTGIGLAVCQRIVKRHGGDIGVVSRPGEGTTFWFTLQAAVEGQDAIILEEAA